LEVGETVAVRSRVEWRRWLAKHHQERSEIWLLYHKKTSGKTGINYEESVEEALCYGWIDGQIKSIDETTYAGRFTPRRPGSNWSASNIARIKKLVAEGSMTKAGLAVIPQELRHSKAPA
jgi:uncharacterized protein YdeI (YjbR/CyaY-like superfamily)